MKKSVWRRGNEMVEVKPKRGGGYVLSAWQWDRGFNERKDFDVAAADLPAYLDMLKKNGFTLDP